MGGKLFTDGRNSDPQGAGGLRHPSPENHENPPLRKNAEDPRLAGRLRRTSFGNQTKTAGEEVLFLESNFREEEGNFSRTTPSYHQGKSGLGKASELPSELAPEDSPLHISWVFS